MGIVQIIIDDSASKIITGNYTFDRENGGRLIIGAGTAFPDDPAPGELFWRTDLTVLYRRNDTNTQWIGIGAGMPNPMTDKGDVIVGGDSGTPTRLAGVSGGFLRSKGNSDLPTFTRDLDPATVLVGGSPGDTPESTAALEVRSTTKGFLPPRLTATQREAISSPANGLIVYDPEEERLFYHDQNTWRILATVGHKLITVSSDGSGNYETISEALASVTDAGPNNPYVISVSPGIYEEDITAKDYVTIKGSGWDTVIKGTVTASGNEYVDIGYCRIEATNAPAAIVSSPGGEVDFTGAYLSSTWDSEAPSDQRRCTLKISGGLCYFYRLTEAFLYVEDTAHPSLDQVVFCIHGTDVVNLEVTACWMYWETANTSNPLYVLLNTNTNASTYALIDGDSACDLVLTGEGHQNEIHALQQKGGGSIQVHNGLRLTVEAEDGLDSTIHAVCSSGALEGSKVHASGIEIVTEGQISDNNLYVGEATGANDSVEVSSITFWTQGDVLPGRYTANGSLGTFTYRVYNNHGSAFTTGRINGIHRYDNATEDPTVPSPSDGDRYYNTAYHQERIYDAGLGAWKPASLPKCNQTVCVGPEGTDAQFQTIKEAVYYAVSNGAGWDYGDWWLIRVAPGEYVEEKITVPPGVVIEGAISERASLVYVSPENPDDDLFVLAGGVLINLSAYGATGTGKAVVHCATAGTLSVLAKCNIQKGYYGVLVENGATVFLDGTVGTVLDPGIETGTWLKVDAAQALLADVGIEVPTAVLPYYAPPFVPQAINPINTGIYATNGARISGAGCSLRIAHQVSGQCALKVDGGAVVTLMASQITDCETAVWLGSYGVGQTIITKGCLLASNDVSAKIETIYGAIYADWTVDVDNRDMVSGARIYGTIQDLSKGRTQIVGDAYVQYETGTEISLQRGFYNLGGTYIAQGGQITPGTGLKVNVAAGWGAIRNSLTLEVASVEWDAVTDLSLTASTTNYIVYDQQNGIQAILSPPSSSTQIHLATVITGSDSIRFMHCGGRRIEGHAGVIQDYLMSTRKIVLDTGLAVSVGSTNRKFSIGSGSYYIALTKIPYTGATDATFSYFYGSGTEVAGQSQVDNTYYDDDGTLTAMSSGYYRTDIVYLTADGRISLIYGQSEYASQVDAENAPIIPPYAFLAHSAISLAKIVVEQGGGIVAVKDIRPQAGAEIGGSGGSITSHSALSDLDKDDHPQYLLVSGARAMSGSLNMGNQNITNAGTVNGVQVDAHASRHLPGGADYLTTGTPTGVLVGATAAEGTEAKFARSDHQHGIASGTPSSIGSENQEGTSTSVARRDHVHAHGNQGGGSLHSAATSSENGFMSSTDKSKLDSVTVANIPTSDEKAALAGTSGSPSNTNRYVTNSDTRLTNARPPTAHATTHEPGGSDAMAVDAAANVGSLRTLGTGQYQACAGNDARLSDARTPTAHASSHKSGGSDVIKLDELGAPTDNTNLNATTSYHGLLPKLSGDSNQYLNGQGSWSAVGGSIFGQDWSYYSDETTSTTTSATWRTKLTVTTPALTGTYLIHAECEISAATANRTVGARLYNSTDSAELGIYQVRASIVNIWSRLSTGAVLTFSGAAKTLAIQWVSDGSTTASCRRARLYFFRVA